MTLKIFGLLYPIGERVRCLTWRGTIVGHVVIDGKQLLQIQLDGTSSPISTMPADLEFIKDESRTIRRPLIMMGRQQ